jgi:hypothetical protein
VIGAALFGLLERVHGHLGVLGLAMLLHPVITLRRRPRLTPWTVRTAEIGAGLLAATFALGWWIYPAYRSGVKPGLLRDAPSVAMRFESKEHLAFCAAALAIAGAVALRRAGTTPSGRRVAWALLLAAWVCGVLTAGLGIFVASIAQPGW